MQTIAHVYPWWLVNWQLYLIIWATIACNETSIWETFLRKSKWFQIKWWKFEIEKCHPIHTIQPASELKDWQFDHLTLHIALWMHFKKKGLRNDQIESRFCGENKTIASLYKIPLNKTRFIRHYRIRLFIIFILGSQWLLNDLRQSNLNRCNRVIIHRQMFVGKQ